jgi:hypothetical protein
MTTTGDPRQPGSSGTRESRPELTAELTGAQLRRWYWTPAELTRFAGSMGIPTGGGRLRLVERLAAPLTDSPSGGTLAPAQPTGPLDEATVIPPGRRCSQALRACFTDRPGPTFHFDTHLRTFIVDGAGRALGDAVAHWHATRDQPTQTTIAPRFEFNRFPRDRHRAHPDGSRNAALAGWRHRRALPCSPPRTAPAQPPPP